MNNLTEFINVVYNTLPMAFKENKSKQKLNFICNNLSSSFVKNNIILELRLNKQMSIDISVSIKQNSETIIKNFNSFFFNKIVNNAFYQNIKKLIKNWEKKEIFKKNIEVIWFEFDSANSYSDKISIPNIFICFKNKSIIIDSNLQQDFRNIKFKIINLVYKILYNKQLLKKTAFNLKNSINLLPETAFLFAVGFMLNRKTDSIRLSIRNIDLNNIVKYLTLINLTEITQNLTNKIKPFYKILDYLALDIDVGKTIGHKIGIELYILKNSSKSLKKLIEKLEKFNYGHKNKINLLSKIQGKKSILSLSNDEILNLNSILIKILYIKFIFEKGEILNPKIYILLPETL
jgi:hypothetical protein